MEGSGIVRICSNKCSEDPQRNKSRLKNSKRIYDIGKYYYSVEEYRLKFSKKRSVLRLLRVDKINRVVFFHPREDRPQNTGFAKIMFRGLHNPH